MGAETGGPREAADEVHARRVRGEVVVNADALETFLEGEHLAPSRAGYSSRAAEVEVRVATPEQNPPHGAVWLTALGADVSLKAPAAEILRVLHEAGVLERLRERGEVDFL